VRHMSRRQTQVEPLAINRAQARNAGAASSSSRLTEGAGTKCERTRATRGKPTVHIAFRGMAIRPGGVFADKGGRTFVGIIVGDGDEDQTSRLMFGAAVGWLQS